MSTHLNQYHGPYHNSPGQTRSPYWKRAHHSWIFWVGALLIFVAMLTYVMSFDLAWRPRVQAAQPPPSATVGK